MRVKVRECADIADPLRSAVDLPAGVWTLLDSMSSARVLSHACPGIFPSYKCPWQIHQDGGALSWDQIEKPKAFDAWMEVLATLLKYWGHDMHGIIEYKGEELEDRGTMKVDTTLHPMFWTQTTGRAIMSGNLNCETSPHVGHWKSLVMQSLEVDDHFWSEGYKRS